MTDLCNKSIHTFYVIKEIDSDKYVMNEHGRVEGLSEARLFSTTKDAFMWIRWYKGISNFAKEHAAALRVYKVQLSREMNPLEEKDHLTS